MDSDQVGQLSISNPELKWVINTKEFDSKKINELIVSPKFYINDIQNIYLNLYPKGHEDFTEATMGLYLRNDNDYDITLDFAFSLLNNNNIHVNKTDMKNCKLDSKSGKGSASFVLINYVFDPANKLIKDDHITIVCTIVGQMVLSDENKNQYNLKTTNEKLFLNKTHSDVIVKCNEQEFYLHKCFLVTRSSVFEAMFETDMVEKEKNMVEINDVDPVVLHQFFKYLYTNTVDDFNKIAKELLIIADKYLVTDLKEKCEETMSRNITLENAIEYLKIADIQNTKKLKIQVMKFISLNKLKNFIGLDTLSKEQLLEIIHI